MLMRAWAPVAARTRDRTDVAVDMVISNRALPPGLIFACW